MPPWNPWRAARHRADLDIIFDDVPEGACWVRDGGRDVILLDVGLDRRARRAALAHELIHVERGIGHPHATAATMCREEAIVRRITASRLVPPEQLRRFVEQATSIQETGADHPVTLDMIADEFDVPRAVARDALLAFNQRS